MLRKFAAVIQADLTTLADWKRHIIASDVHADPSGAPDLKELDLDTDQFLYLRVRAVSAGEAHGANCFVPGTPISLADGSRVAIENVRIGDEIITHSGGPGIVCQTFRRDYSGDVVRFRPLGFSTWIECTPEHPIWTVPRSEYRRAFHSIVRARHWRNPQQPLSDAKTALMEALSPSFVPAGQLGVGDRLYAPFPTRVRGCPELQPDNPDFAALLGYYTSEGCLARADNGHYANGLRGVIFVFGPTDQCAIQRVIAIAAKQGRKVSPRRNGSGRSVRLALGDTHFADICLRHIGCKSQTKRLSWDVLTMPLEWQRQFLGAYLSGDGSIKKGNNRYTGTIIASTASPELARTIQLLAARLGLPVCVNQDKQRGGFGYGNPIWVMQIGSQSVKESGIWKVCDRFESPPIRVPNSTKLKIHNGYIVTSVAQLERRPYRGPVFNLEVTGDNSYLAGGVAVHNCNGDWFGEDELKKSYHSFVRRGVYIDHKSDDPSAAVGIILDSVWHDDGKYVECLVAIDKNEPIAKKIANGIAQTWSMGALIAKCRCNICDKVAHNENQYCGHLQNYMGKEYNGRKVYAINEGINFYEISAVTVPADQSAVTLEVLASKKDEEPKRDFGRLVKLAQDYEAKRLEWDSQAKVPKGKHQLIIHSLDDVAAECSVGDWHMAATGPRTREQVEAEFDRHLAQHVAEAKDLKEVVSDVRGKLETAAPRKEKEHQIVARVRRQLKAARAPLVARPGPVYRRVEAALAADPAPEERPTSPNRDTIPLEGLKVENQLTIRYIPGDALEECYFIARRGNLQTSVRASEILDSEVQKRIVEAEAAKGAHMEKTAAEPAEELKDESKPKPDNVLEMGKDPEQPKDVVNPLSAKPAEELKDESKPKPDNTLEVGKDPAQPSDVVKKYAQLIGAKSVTFKLGENGSFTATLPDGKISRLAALWNSELRLVKSAKVAGEPMQFARESAKPVQTDMRDKPAIAREDKSGELAKASGNLGSEIKGFYQQLDSKNLSQGGEAGWARKVAELAKTAEKLAEENKALKLEADALRKVLETQKQAAVDSEKRRLIGGLMEYMEKAGAIRASEDAVLDYQMRGLSLEDSQTKAFAEAKERKVAELKDLSPQALQAMLSNLNDIVPAVEERQAVRKTAGVLPIVGRDERLSEEDRLAQNW